MSHLTSILDLTASFSDVVNPTPFGIYDAEASFVSASDNMVQFSYRKLGGSILQVELTNKDVYTCFEEAALEYSSVVNSYQAKSIMADVVGSATGSLEGKENKVARLNLALAKRRADAYSSEALVGGTRALLSSSITLSSSQQNYDLKVLLSSSGIISGNERVEIREIFHFSPTAAYRFFDTTSAVNYLHNEFSFESFTPETVFYLLPIWEDVLRAQQLEQSHRIRRSNYSYNIVDNVLRIYPVPTSSRELYFTYYLVSSDDNPFNSEQDPLVDGIANMSNIPFGNISYEKINSIGKQWIRRFALALIKEVLGQVRGKVSTVPIPNGDLTLNGPALIAEARDDQLNLRQELKEIFDETTYEKLQEQETKQADDLMRQLGQIPTGIWVGTFLLCLFTRGLM
jgi:hypothetical protein